MITRLKIENFTAFDSLELDFGEGIHAFIGANGTGKTHLLKIMYSLRLNIGCREVKSVGLEEGKRVGPCHVF